jgi:hypothetical protein
MFREKKKTRLAGVIWISAFLGLVILASATQGGSPAHRMPPRNDIALLQQPDLGRFARSVEEFTAAVVPEPSTLVLAVLGGSALLVRRRHAPARVRVRR